MSKIFVLEIEGQRVKKGKYYCVGFAYKNDLLKAIVMNETGEVFPVDYHRVVLDIAED